ncbi:hypothetical protein EDD15DRAFT_2464864 [Pisolithus albus]|nr:hypothetical protein EDD15DRAFT_2464864 [Pisolithus albus]
MTSTIYNHRSLQPTGPPTQGPVTSQINELNIIRQSLYELESQHGKIRQQYEEELSRLRAELHAAGQGLPGGAPPHQTVGPGTIGPSGPPTGPPTVSGIQPATGPASYPDPYYTCERDRDRDRDHERDKDRERLERDRERELRDRERDQRDRERERPPVESSCDPKCIKTEHMKTDRPDHYSPSLGTGPTKLPAPAGPPAYQGPGLPPPPSVHPAYAPGPGNPPPGGPIESNPGASGALAPAGSASGSQFPDDLDPHNVPPEWKKEGVDWFAVFNPKVKQVVTGRHKSMTPNQVKRHACLPMSQLLERWETSTSAVFASALMGSSRATGAEDKQIRVRA